MAGDKRDQSQQKQSSAPKRTTVLFHGFVSAAAVRLLGAVARANCMFPNPTAPLSTTLRLGFAERAGDVAEIDMTVAMKVRKETFFLPGGRRKVDGEGASSRL